MLRKCAVFLIKILPFILAFKLYTVIHYPTILPFIVSEMLRIICDISLIVVVIILSFTFGFCYYHRLFLYFIILYYLCELILLILNKMEYFLFAPALFNIIFILSGVSIYLHLKQK